MTAITVGEILQDCYKYKNADAQIRKEASMGYIVEAINVNDGVSLSVAGMEYPEKGVAPTNDIFACNISKKIIIESLRLLPLLSPLLIIFVFLPWKVKTKILNRLLKTHNIISMKVMSPSIFKDAYLTPMAKEVKSFLTVFLTKLDLDILESRDFAEIFANIINFDNAYRYRIQDLFNETTKEQLKYRTEIKRLLLLNRDREVQHHVHVSNKFKLFATVISYGLLHPKIKHAYLTALNEVNYNNLKPDEADKFWMCVRVGYNFFGQTDEERRQSINHLRVSKPTQL